MDERYKGGTGQSPGRRSVTNGAGAGAEYDKDRRTAPRYNTGASRSYDAGRGREYAQRNSTYARESNGRKQTAGMNRPVKAVPQSESSLKTKDKNAASRPARKKPMTEAERRKKMEQIRKRERLRRQRIRAAAVFIVTVLVIIILLFMTPVFSVRQIILRGNNLVSKEQIEVQIKDYVGDNLFRLRSSAVEKKMLEIPMINGAAVEKKLIPPSLIINITETRPAAYLLSGNNIVVVNSDLKAIDDTNSFDTNTIPSISGISVPGYTLNEIIQVDSAEKADILREMLKVFENTGLNEYVKYVSVDDLSDIRFNYDNRIEAICGSHLELERKIRMFAEAIRTDKIASDALGTMDLSIPGQATYQP